MNFPQPEELTQESNDYSVVLHHFEVPVGYHKGFPENKGVSAEYV